MNDLRSYKSRGTPDCPIALYIVGNGHGMPPHLHHHPELEFVVLYEGEMDYRLGEAVLHMAAGSVLITAPGQLHGPVSYTLNAKFCFFNAALHAIAMPPEHIFQKEFVQPLQNNLLQLPSLVQPGHPAYEAFWTTAAKLPEYLMSTPNYKLNRYHALVSMCVAIAPWCVHLDDSVQDALPGNAAVRRAMLYIHNKYETPLDLQTIADHVHLNPNYLCALFKAHTGQTVMQYLIRKRIDAAIFLLQDSNLPIEVIAEKTGFRSRGLFFRHFRQITGMTPKAYQQHQRQGL